MIGCVTPMPVRSPSLRLLLAASWALFFTLTVSGAASAQIAPKAPLVLTWDAPATCPEKAFVESEVLRLLGGSAASETERLTAKARVTEAGDVWRVDIDAARGATRTTRTFRGNECASVARAAALMIALVINPALIVDPKELAAPSEPPTPKISGPVSAQEPKKQEAPPTPPPTRRSLEVFASVGAMADVHTLPKVGFGPTLALGISIERVTLEATAAFAPNRDMPLTDKAGVGATFQKLSVGTRSCVLALHSELTLGPCLGIEASQVRAKSFGIQVPGESMIRWAEGLAGGQLGWRFSAHFGVRLDAGAGVLLARRDVRIAPYGEVHRLGPVTGRFALSTEVRF